VPCRSLATCAASSPSGSPRDGRIFGFGDGWAQYDTTTHGTGLAVTAGLYGEPDRLPPVCGPNSEATSGRLPHMRRCPAGGGDRFARFDSKAVFRDDVESYSTVEPAIDLTATGPLAFALVAAGRCETPPTHSCAFCCRAGNGGVESRPVYGEGVGL